MRFFDGVSAELTDFRFLGVFSAVRFAAASSGAVIVEAVTCKYNA